MSKAMIICFGLTLVSLMLMMIGCTVGMIFMLDVGTWMPILAGIPFLAAAVFGCSGIILMFIQDFC